MIRINLAPVKRKKKAKPIPTFIIGLVAVILLSVGGVGWTVFWMNGEVKDRSTQLQRDRAKLEELKKKVKEVEDYEKNEAEFRQKIEIIEGLKRNQNAPTRFLHELAGNLADGVWIKKISENNWTIKLDGYGFSNADIVNFMDNLKSSPYVMNVQLTQTAQTVVEDVQLYSFEATFTLNLKADEPEGEPKA